MAKRRRTAKQNGAVNKSQAIRDALSLDPEASPSKLAAELTSKGIKVVPAFVSMIKTKLKGGRSRRRMGRTGDHVSTSELVAAKKLVDDVGGIEKAEVLLDTLKRLT